MWRTMQNWSLVEPFLVQIIWNLLPSFNSLLSVAYILDVLLLAVFFFQNHIYVIVMCMELSKFVYVNSCVLQQLTKTKIIWLKTTQYAVTFSFIFHPSPLGPYIHTTVFSNRVSPYSRLTCKDQTTHLFDRKGKSSSSF